jgi:hypothetical protein
MFFETPSHVPPAARDLLQCYPVPTFRGSMLNSGIHVRARANDRGSSARAGTDLRTDSRIDASMRSYHAINWARAIIRMMPAALTKICVVIALEVSKIALGRERKKYAETEHLQRVSATDEDGTQ